MRRFTIVLFSAMVLVGCADRHESQRADYGSVVAEAEMADAMPAAPSAVMVGGKGGAYKPAPSRHRVTTASKRRGAPAQEPMDAEAMRPAEAPKPKRMVHYNGYLKLRVSNPTQTLQHASEIADEAGGYVESLTATTVTVRVPVAKFRVVFSKVAKIGEVLSRSMTAQDVTDAFVALDLRVKTLRASRDRLIALLGRAKKTREKLRLLREIQRLTESIDQLEMHLTTLKSLADLSRLTVEVVPHQVHVNRAADEPIASFRWIHRLSPFRRDIANYGDGLEFVAPEGLVALSDTDSWIAESADGAVLWASEHDMSPVGTTDFWIEAVKTRLERVYGNAELLTLGQFKMVRVVDTGETAYRYLVGVRVVDRSLQLVEVYYPSEEHEKRYGAAIRSAIERGPQ